MDKKRKTRRKLRKLEERSDKRTAAFLVNRLEEIQTDLGDLIPDLQTFDDYTEISLVSLCIRLLKELRKKYHKRSEGFEWVEED